MEELNLSIALALLVLGLSAGTYGVLIGSGGGFIVAPLLIVLFQLDHNIAVGTSMVTVFLASISGSIGYLKLKRVDIRSSLLFSLAAVPGTFLGVQGLKLVPADIFQIVLGIILILLGLFLVLRPNSPQMENTVRLSDSINKPQNIQNPSRRFGTTTRLISTVDKGTFEYTYNEPLAISANGLFGFMSGFFGMGGGPIRTPTLIYIFKFPTYIATATSVFTQGIYTGAGSIMHLIDGNVDTNKALLLGIGIIIGAQIAVKLSQVLQAQNIMRLLSVSFLIIGFQLIRLGLRTFQ